MIFTDAKELNDEVRQSCWMEPLICLHLLNHFLSAHVGIARKRSLRHVSVCPRAYWVQRSMSSVFFYCFPTYILWQDLLMKLECTYVANWQISKPQEPSCLFLPSSRIIGLCRRACLLCGCWDSNLAPYAFYREHITDLTISLALFVVLNWKILPPLSPPFPLPSSSWSISTSRMECICLAWI